MVLIKNFSLSEDLPHDVKTSCGCLLPKFLVFRGKADLSDKVIMYVNTLRAMAAGFIGSMDNYLFHKLMQEFRGQLCRFGVLLDKDEVCP